MESTNEFIDISLEVQLLSLEVQLWSKWKYMINI
jgi:hypothetical protein